MNKLLLAALALLAPAWLRADDAPAAGAQAEDSDVYYAPVDESAAAAADLSPVAAVSAGSQLSHARIVAFPWGSPGTVLPGAELFLNGAYLGRSPLDLQGLLVDRTSAVLTARLDGYREAVRGRLRFPADGVVKVGLLPDDAASWYTTPCWVVGLGLLGAALAVYKADNTGPGLALAGGGVAVISLSQLTARFVHLPGLKREVEAFNNRPEPSPPTDPGR